MDPPFTVERSRGLDDDFAVFINTKSEAELVAWRARQHASFLELLEACTVLSDKIRNILDPAIFQVVGQAHIGFLLVCTYLFRWPDLGTSRLFGFRFAGNRLHFAF